MILGFLGKGGSGKSTLSSLYALYAHQKGFKVLAVDADHNMDLTYNLHEGELTAYIGQGIEDVLKCAGVSGGYREVFDLETPPEFSLDEEDTLMKRYAHKSSSGVYVMAAGPHTDKILYDESCSHSLVTPLKVYLPHLAIKGNEVVVVDEKAGTDSVGTGVTTGFTAAVVVAEPTVHGIKAAKQISELLEFYETPYVFVLNKVRSDNDKKLFVELVGREPDYEFPFSSEVVTPRGHVPEAYISFFEALESHTRAIPDTRLERSRRKMQNNKNFKLSHKTA